LINSTDTWKICIRLHSSISVSPLAGLRTSNVPIPLLRVNAQHARDGSAMVPPRKVWTADGPKTVN
jgi:hypothetical protein